MYDFKITNDNGQIDWITCKNRTEAIETYCLVYGYTKEYVKKHCVVRKTFLPRTAEWYKSKGDKDTDDGDKAPFGEIVKDPEHRCLYCQEIIPQGRDLCGMCEIGREFLNKKE